MSARSIEFTAVVKKFDSKGEKTGWTYIEVLSGHASCLNPDNKKSFRIKGFINKTPIKQLALIPMGGGDFILPLNNTIRKTSGIVRGDQITVKIELDTSKFTFDSDFIECLNDDEDAKSNFKMLAPSHQNYFSKWIAEAKTDQTKTKRITMAVNALSSGLNFAEMLKANKKNG